MKMTKAEKTQCKEIIQRHASNVVYYLAHAMEATTKMTLELAEVFNIPMTENLARATAVEKLKEIEYALYKPPFFLKALFYFIPIPPVILARAKIELVGWQIAEDFANQRG